MPEILGRKGFRPKSAHANLSQNLGQGHFAHLYNNKWKCINVDDAKVAYGIPNAVPHMVAVRAAVAGTH